MFQNLINQFCLPIFWGWKASNNFTFTPNSSKNLFQNLDVNWSSQLKMISSRRPYDIGTHDQEITWLFFHQLLICCMEWNEPSLSSNPPPLGWNQMNWNVANLWWSPWRSKTMVQKEWVMVEGIHVGDDNDFLFKCKHR